MKRSKSNKLNLLSGYHTLSKNFDRLKQQITNVLSDSNIIQAERLEKDEHTYQTTTRVSRTKVLETPLFRYGLLFPALIAGIVSCSSQESQENQRDFASPILQADETDDQISQLTARIIQLEESNQSVATQITNLSTNVQNIYENKARVLTHFAGRKSETGYAADDGDGILGVDEIIEFKNETGRSSILTGSLMLRTQSFIAARFHAVSKSSDGRITNDRLLFRMSHQVAPGAPTNGHSSIRLPFFAFLNTGEFLQVIADYCGDGTDNCEPEQNSFNELRVSNVFQTKIENTFVP